MTRTAGQCGPAAWVGLAVAALLCLSVLLINNAPLYYFDSFAYQRQGTSILKSLLGAEAIGAPEIAAPTGGTDTASGKIAREDDDKVSGNRSATYALMFAAARHFGGTWAPVLVSFAAVLLTAYLAARIFARTASSPVCTTTLMALPLGIAALTSLPFYIAFLMPDIFTGLALLMIALLVAYARDMRPGEILLAGLIIAIAAVAHRSTLVIVALLVPVTAIGAGIVAGRRWWLATLIVALGAALGFGELKGYEKAADKVFDRTTVYSPFLTARLIADGPGWDYLQSHCPDPDIATCKLAEALSRSDDPWRLTASHILFEPSERLGSFKLMSPDDQRLVAQAQRTFVLDVFADQPVAVIASVLRNTLRQTAQVSIQMTVAEQKTVDRISRRPGLENTDFGRLTEDRAWIDSIDTLHTVIYGLSLGALAVAFILPGALDRRQKALVAMLLMGILANAFVCGAVSQPADRYGARVSWLLPYIATMMSVFSVKTLTLRKASLAASKGK